MIPAPRIIGGYKVVVYSTIDSRLRPSGCCKHTVAGVVQGPAKGLAICEPKPDEGAFLFGCDGHWNVQTDSWFDSIEDAMYQAEIEYTGVRRTWLNHGPAWELLSSLEEDTVWKLFEEQFAFRRSAKPGFG